MVFSNIILVYCPVALSKTERFRDWTKSSCIDWAKLSRLLMKNEMETNLQTVVG